MPISALVKAKGLYTFPNKLGNLPEGALLTAKNVIINRDGIIEPMRGFFLYGDLGAGVTKQLLNYKDRLIRHIGSTLQYDNGSGTFTSFTGSYSETETGLRIKGLETNGNFYFTTSSGVKSISVDSADDLVAGSISNAGISKALDLKLTLNTETGFFTQESVVGYRILWGIKDANNNTKYGSPSERTIVYNSLTDLLITDFNNLLDLLDDVSNSGGINDANYVATLAVAVGSSAATLRTNLLSLATKLDNDTVITEGTIDTVSGSLTSNVASLVFDESVATFLEIGNSIVISGLTLTLTPLNGTHVLTGVSTTTITFALVNADIGSAGDTLGIVKRLNYTLITQPGSLSASPTTAELEDLQDYYNAVVTDLQAEPSGIITSTTPFDTANATESSTVDLLFTIPETITTSYFYQIYRTALSTSTGASVLTDFDPGDEMKLVYEANPSSSDISNGYISVQDITPDDFRGTNLYTNPNSGEGILQSNDPPPLCKDIALYKGYTFYANTTSKHVRRLALLSVDDLIADTSTITISDGTTTTIYTFSTTEDTAAKKILISTEDTVAQQVDETSRSLERVVNKQSGEIVYAYYLSGPDDVPGLLLFEARDFGQNPFYLTVNSSATGGEFNPVLPTTGQTVISSDEVSPNRVFYSKRYQPEAVPSLNFIDIGPKDSGIRRIVALRDSLFNFKEDGSWKISGEVAPFVVNEFDKSVKINAPDSAAVLNNLVYMSSDQGVVRVSDTGIDILSRPQIEDTLIQSFIATNFSTVTFGIGYETDRTYHLWTTSSSDDTVATQCYVYNIFTNSWTIRDKSSKCGLINSADGKMYIGASDVNYIEKERKNLNRTDHAGREHAITVAEDQVVTNTFKIDSGIINDYAIDDVVVQEQYLDIDTLNQCLQHLDDDEGVIDINYESTLGASAGNNLRTILTDLAIKLDADTGVADTDYASTISGYGTTFQDTQDAYNDIVNKLNADSNVVFQNYQLSEDTTTYEDRITDVNYETSVITTVYSQPWIMGAATIYKAEEREIEWSHDYMGDVVSMKQARESQIFFENDNFTFGYLAHSTDLSPGYSEVTISGSGNGAFGLGTFGEQTFGGQGSKRPRRVLIPLSKQRGRGIGMRWRHTIAREGFSIQGTSKVFETSSSRAYKS